MQTTQTCDEWKEFIAKPSLKYILRFLTGLATEHERTQLAVASNSIPVIHRLEQVRFLMARLPVSLNNFCQVKIAFTEIWNCFCISCRYRLMSMLDP